MINLEDKYQCCGCEACAQACPKQCITFVEDLEGFYYPKVDEKVCVECGMCEKVCPMSNQANPAIPLKVFVAKNRNKKELLSSSSGGLFIVLAKEVVKSGGVVFGAKFDEDWNVVHAFTDTLKGLNDFMGSKYVQSRIGNCFCEVKNFLKEGRKVLFTGTSCQILSLKNFLQCDYDNLLTMDVICHGVPSPGIWRKYLEEIKQNAWQGEKSVSLSIKEKFFKKDPFNTKDKDIRIESISFRDKRLGWKKFSFALTLAKTTFDGKKKTLSLSNIYSEDPYMKLFLGNYTLRYSCYNCPAKGGRSNSDITIADYWGIEKQHPEITDIGEGVGLLIVNTQKGKDYLGHIELDLTSSTIESATASNMSYYISKKEPLERSMFFCQINNGKSIRKMAYEFFKVPLRKRIIRKIKKVFKQMAFSK